MFFITLNLSQDNRAFNHRSCHQRDWLALLTIWKVHCIGRVLRYFESCFAYWKSRAFIDIKILIWWYDNPCSSIKDYPRKVWPIFAKTEPISNFLSALIEWLFWFADSGPRWFQKCVLNWWLCTSRWILQITMLLVLVGFPYWHVSGCQEQVGWGTRLHLLCLSNWHHFVRALILMSQIPCHRLKWIYRPN